MKILINGILPFDSGKTTFSLFLLKELRNSGLDVRPLKPVAGHNAWYSFTTLVRSHDLGILVGNDALKYYDETHLDIRQINPFAALFSPVDLEKIHFNIDYYNELMSQGLPVLVRISCEKDEYYGINFEKLIPNSLYNSLDQLYQDFNPTILSVEKLRELIYDSWRIADHCITLMSNNLKEKREENVIIESYNDASAPTESSKDADIIFTVSPGKVFIIDGKEFRKIIDFLLQPAWMIKTSKLIKYARIEKTFDIDVLTSKNEKILDYLLHDL
ncbi:ATPase [Acidianus sulfidivorans JP7]|uniref:ATPase n=1 Tax=Acidianus sulfidivorans JP7 TaxID=619593 RepID=A0A2U9ILY3_9CREN|nr:ATPase [Acidianus sulfidivorans]AWR97036.1 ATPase [Acidianus sulfidivorans JP7]